jgi:hypothetical protein
MGMMVHVCDLSYVKDKSKRIPAPDYLGKSMRHYLKNNYSKRGWRHHLSGRLLAQQFQGPEFKTPVLHKKVNSVVT